MVSDKSMSEQINAIKILHNAVSVKKAFLIEEDASEGLTYRLQHYNTIILKVVRGNVTFILPNISQSSNRAINQALEYLGIPKSTKDFRLKNDRLDFSNRENRA